MSARLINILKTEISVFLNRKADVKITHDSEACIFGPLNGMGITYIQINKLP